MESETHELAPGVPVEIESSIFSGPGGVGLRITVDFPDDPGDLPPEPPVRPARAR